MLCILETEMLTTLLCYQSREGENVLVVIICGKPEGEKKSEFRHFLGLEV